MNLTVVIPCYKGGELFKSAVESLRESNLKYSRLIVSFNGKQCDLKTWLESQYIDQKIILDIICHEGFLPAKDHMAKVSDYIFTKYGNINLMLMAHDDVLISSEEQNYCLDTVVFPDYGNDRNLCSLGEISDFEFLKLSFTKAMYTNMSGMIISSEIFKSACSYFHNKRTGSRFEHMLALNVHCKRIIFSRDIKVYIKERNDSDGALINSMDSRSDELKYLQYYLKNKKVDSFKGKIVFLGLCIRKVLSYVLYRLV